MAKRRFVLANNPLLSGPALQEREGGIGSPYREIPLASVERDPSQPRVYFDQEQLEELAQSIRSYGILNPILVAPLEVAGKYRLISGERRTRAARLAGLTTIPALMRVDGGDGEGDKLMLQLVENLQRSDLTVLERAHAMRALKEAHGLSIRQIGERLGVSKSLVQRSLELLALPEDLLDALREGASESKVLMLAKVADVALRANYLKDLDLISRDSLEHSLAEKGAATKKKRRTSEGAKLSPEDLRIMEEMQRALGLRVVMKRPSETSVGGKLVIHFYSDSDLQEIFRKLVGQE